LKQSQINVDEEYNTGKDDEKWCPICEVKTMIFLRKSRQCLEFTPYYEKSYAKKYPENII